MKNKTNKKGKEQDAKPVQEGNKYDKILHEIGDVAIFPIVTEDLGIKVHKFTYAKAKMQTTLEREVDECYWIETEDDDEIMLHMEYQSYNDPKMVLRVNLYVAMIQFNYPDKKIESVVVYIGEDEPTMRTQLRPHEIFTGFKMIVVKKLDHQKLLSSHMPYQVIMTILADYEKEDAKEVIHKIIARLRTLCETEKDYVKCCKQLLIFSIIRKLDGLTKEILQNMPVHIDIVHSDVFKEAFEPERIKLRRRIKEEQKRAEQEQKRAEQEQKRAEQEQKRAEQALAEQQNTQKLGILNLLRYSSLSIKQIADSFNVEEALVLKIKKELLP